MCSVNKWFDCLCHKVITALRIITEIHEKQVESETVCFPFHYTALKVLFVTICWVWAWVYSWASPAEIWHTEYAKTCSDNLVHSEGPASWGWKVSTSVQSLVFMKSVDHAGEVSLNSKTADWHEGLQQRLWWWCVQLSSYNWAFSFLCTYKKNTKNVKKDLVSPSKQGEKWSSYWWTITILKFQLISYDIIHSCQVKKKMFKYGSKQISARVITLSYPDGLFTIALSIFWIKKFRYLWFVFALYFSSYVGSELRVKYRINSTKILILTGNLCHNDFWAFQIL